MKQINSEMAPGTGVTASYAQLPSQSKTRMFFGSERNNRVVNMTSMTNKSKMRVMNLRYQPNKQVQSKYMMIS